MPLRFLKPVESLLPLAPEDKFLEAGQHLAQIPPRSLDEACHLTYYIVNQSVCAGTHILDHLLRNPPGDSSHLAPLMLYRHALEIGDSIGTLLRLGSSTTASILMRGLFETSLGLEFILENNSFHRDRAICYHAFNHIERFKNFDRYDPNTSAGKELHRILDADKNLDAAVFPRKDLSKERQVLDEILNSSEYKPFWNQFKAAKPKPKHWYSLCSTAQDIRSLSRLIGREAEYVLLYRMLSEAAHAADVLTGIVSQTEDRKLQVHMLRGPVEKIKEVTSLTAGYLISCHNLLLNTYLKSHDVQRWFADWYVAEYRSCFFWATSPGALFSESTPNS